MTIDFDSFFRNRIESLMIKASWIGPVRDMLGIEGVSQIWSENAQWYFWLHGAPGVYRLEFAKGYDIEANGRRLREGCFIIKCYPYPDHAYFNGYSRQERLLVESDWFDSTKTPKFEIAAAIPDSLFTIGTFSFFIDPQEPLSLLHFESMDAINSRKIAYGPPDSGETAAELVRSVKGWGAGLPLFDCLVGLYAHFIKAPPVFAGVTRSQGFEDIIRPDRRIESRPTDDTNWFSLSIGFDPLSPGHQQIEEFWRTRLDSEEDVLACQGLPVSFKKNVCYTPPEFFSPNLVWWTVAGGNFQSELTSLCGCDGNQCHHREKAGPIDF